MTWQTHSALGLVVLTIITAAKAVYAAESTAPSDELFRLPMTEEPASVAAPVALHEFEQLALKASPTVGQAEARGVAAYGRGMQAAAPRNPTLAYDGSSIGANGTAGSQGVFVDQEIATAGKRQSSLAVGLHATNREKWRTEAERLRILNQVRRRYFEVLALQERIRIERHFAREAHELRLQTSKLQDSDEANEADLLLANSDARRRQLQSHTTESNYRTAWLRLAATVGRTDIPVTYLPGNLSDAFVSLPAHETEWVQRIECHPALQAAREEVLQRQAAVARAKAGAVPNVTVRVGSDYDFDAEEVIGRVRLSVPLQLYDRNQGAILAAEAELREAQLEVTRVGQALERRVLELREQHARNRAIVEEYRAYILPETERAYRKYLERFKDEESSFSRVKSSQGSYRDRSLEYLDALLNLRRAEVDLSTLDLSGTEDTKN